MPKVQITNKKTGKKKTKHYPYTKEGMAAAAKASNKKGKNGY